MFSLHYLAGLALGYVLVLFIIAWWGDRAARQKHPLVNNAWVYSLGLGVYCTSWTFYGAVGEAAHNGWNYLPIYLGPILIVVFGGAMIYKIISVGHQQNTTSIADFLAARYGKSRRLAVLVTVVAVIGILPYIALQLKAVTQSFDYLLLSNGQPAFNTAFAVAVLMALFTLLFGTRHIDASEHQSGLMLAVAFESFVKLVAFLAVGLFCLFVVFSGPADLWRQSMSSAVVVDNFEAQPFSQAFITALLLSMAAIVCLPRQFHAGVVENYDLRHLRTSRWVFPLYLLLFAVFVLPIVLAGILTQPELINQADSYMLSLPGENGSAGLALLAFIGGIAASTGMVIVSTMALAIMLTNEVLLPSWVQLRMQGKGGLNDLSQHLRWLRRISIVILLLLSYFFHTLIDRFDGLAGIGLLSFAAVVQFAPALFGGLYWRNGHKIGALAGIFAGFVVWVYTLLLPSVLPQTVADSLRDEGLLGIALLRTDALMGIGGLDPLTHGVFWSLLVNTLLYIVFSRRARHSALDRAQATRYVDMPTDWWREGSAYPTITSAELLNVCEKGLGNTRAQLVFDDYLPRHGVSPDLQLPAPLHLVRHVERLLAGSMGASTARIVMGSLLRKLNVRHQDVAQMMDEASELIQFNHQLLRTTIETINQGICVVDPELRVVAWNQAYVRLFDYPQGLVRLGRPVEDLYHYNARRGYYDGDDLDAEVKRRVQLLKEGCSHQFERELPNGTILDVRGTPMVGGGFVSTYMDITKRKRDEQTLRQINENLEVMVSERTRRLSDLNAQLARANEGKSRFLAAAGHDLMQPLNAAQLFVASLRQGLNRKPDASQGAFSQELSMLGHIDQSLHAAEHIITSLLEISKLDTGAMIARTEEVSLAPLLATLGQEFDALAAAQGLSFRLHNVRAVVNTDPALLRRVLQNFLSNAARYTESGRIVLGCRRMPNAIRVEVWDTGPGIPAHQHQRIFHEFQRLPQQGQRQVDGLGLGLAIVERIGRLLKHPIHVRSWPGKGTVFSITLPRAEVATQQMRQQPLVDAVAPPTAPLASLEGVRVLCVDNDAALLASLKAALEGLGCEVLAASNSHDAAELAAKHPSPDVVLVDYQLDDENGFEVLQVLDGCWDDVIPAFLMTADRRPEIRQQAEEMGIGFLPKPLTETMLQEALSDV